MVYINPYVTNGHFHPSFLDESTFVFRGSRSNFSFLFHFSMKFLKANSLAPDETLHSADCNWRLIWGYTVPGGLCGLKIHYFLKV